MMKNGVQLITYPDSLGGTLKTLGEFLQRHWEGALSGLHILPFYPSAGDRGFSPTTYDMVEPFFGTWADIAALGERYELMADFMVNHLSRSSEPYRDWIARGEESPFEGLFLPVERIFPRDPSPEEIAKIYRRNPREPWVAVRQDSGAERRLWCTFSEDQIDIDILSQPGIALFRDTLETLAENGVNHLRLDAVGYVVKKAGTSCFMVEPEIWELLERLRLRRTDSGFLFCRRCTNTTVIS